MDNENETVDLERVRVDLEAWRGQRQGGGGRVPEQIWRQATRAATQHGVKEVSRRLGLNYQRLKQRVRVATVAAPLFVEVGGEDAEEKELPCVVELEKSNGTRLRIRAREVAGVDWGKIKEAFLGA